MSNAIQNNRKLVGLQKEIEDAATGALAEFHRVGVITLNRRDGVCRVTMDSYVNQDKFNIGKIPVNFLGDRHFPVSTSDGLPDSLDLDSYAMLQVAQMEVDVYGNPNPFHGATPVYAD